MDQEVNPELRRAVFSIVNNQIRNNDPPETRQTFERLIADGRSRSEARRLIATAVVVEIFDIMKHDKPFDKDRFLKNLARLPEEPWDDEDEDGR